MAADDEPYTELHEKFGSPDPGLAGRLALDWGNQGAGPVFNTGFGKLVDQTGDTYSRQQGQSETGPDRPLPRFHNEPPAGSAIRTATQVEECFSKAKRHPLESYPDPEDTILEGGGSEGTCPRRTPRTFTHGHAGGEPQR